MKRYNQYPPRKTVAELLEADNQAFLDKLKNLSRPSLRKYLSRIEMDAAIELFNSSKKRWALNKADYLFYDTLKLFVWPEITRRRLEKDTLLQADKLLPVPNFTNLRALEAQKRAAMVGDDYVERFFEKVILESRRKVIDARFGVMQNFEDYAGREVFELQERGMGYELAYTIQKDWEIGVNLRAEEFWEKWNRRERSNFLQDIQNRELELERQESLKGVISAPKPPINLGSYPLRDLEAILKELKSVAVELPQKVSESLKHPHLLILKYNGAGLLTFRAGAEESAKERVILSSDQKTYSKAKVQIWLPIEQLSQILAVKPQRYTDKKIKRQWKRVLETVQDGLITLELDGDMRTMHLRGSAYEANLSIIQAEKISESANPL